MCQLSVPEESCTGDASWAVSEPCEKLYLETLRLPWHFTALQLPVSSKETSPKTCFWVAMSDFFCRLEICFFMCNCLFSQRVVTSLLCSADPHKTTSASRLDLQFHSLLCRSVAPFTIKWGRRTLRWWLKDRLFSAHFCHFLRRFSSAKLTALCIYFVSCVCGLLQHGVQQGGCGPTSWQRL